MRIMKHPGSSYRNMGQRSLMQSSTRIVVWHTQAANVTVTLPIMLYLWVCEAVCESLWLLNWIAVAPLATPVNPLSNNFRLLTAKGFKNVPTIQINKLGSIKATQTLSIHIIAV